MTAIMAALLCVPVAQIHFHQRKILKAAFRRFSETSKDIRSMYWLPSVVMIRMALPNGYMKQKVSRLSVFPKPSIMIFGQDPFIVTRIKI